MELSLVMALKAWADPKYPKIKELELFPPRPSGMSLAAWDAPNSSFPQIFPWNPLGLGTILFIPYPFFLGFFSVCVRVCLSPHQLRNFLREFRPAGTIPTGQSGRCLSEIPLPLLFPCFYFPFPRLGWLFSFSSAARRAPPPERNHSLPGPRRSPPCSGRGFPEFLLLFVAPACARILFSSAAAPRFYFFPVAFSLSVPPRFAAITAWGERREPQRPLLARRNPWGGVGANSAPCWLGGIIREPTAPPAGWDANHNKDVK